MGAGSSSTARPGPSAPQGCSSPGTSAPTSPRCAVRRTLGADRMIDYTKEDFTKNGQTYDVIFDAVGKHSFKRCRGSLEPGGFYLPTDGAVNILLALMPSRKGAKRVVFQLPPRQPKKDVLFLKELVEAGKYRPVIDRRYPLEDVIEATRYVETRQKTGNVVLTVNGARGNP